MSTSPPLNPDATIDNSLPQSQSLSPDPIVIINVPISTKLTRTNFLAWQSQILPVLHGFGLHKYITTSSPAPNITSSTGVVSTNPLASPWRKQDQIILAWLRSSLSETLLGQVVSCSTSLELWQNLQQTFSASSRARLNELRRKLQNTTKGSSSCSEFLQKMRSIADELAFIGSPLSDDDLSMYILGGLGPEFNSAVAAA